MTRRTPRTAVAVPLAVLALLLGGCSGDDAPAETPSAAVEETPQAPETEDATTPAEEEDDTETSAAGADECLVGEWAGDPEQQVAASTEMLVAAGLEVSAISVTGEAITEFTATEVISRYDNQVTDITMAMMGQEIRTVTRNHGSTAGSYSVTGDELTMSDIDASALEVSSETYIDGVLQPVAATSAEQAEAAVAGMEVTMGYVCDGDTLTMTTPDFGTDLTVETVLHRR